MTTRPNSVAPANGAVGRLLDALGGVKRAGSAWIARCPAHEDRVQSLSVREGKDGRALLHCHAGCPTEAVLKALNMTTADLFSQPHRNGRRVVAAYDYKDESRKLLFQVVRYDPKDFRQRKPDGAGGWVYQLEGVRRVLYRLPELLADKAVPVFVVEGEKDADRLAKLGLTATTNAGGAGKWRRQYAEALRGRTVYILPDNDPPGEAHAEQVRRSLQGVAVSAVVVRLPGLPNKGDVSDWLAAGGDKDTLLALAAQSAGAPGRTEAGGGMPPPTFDGSPQPITTALLPVPTLDPLMLPAPFRDWQADIARRGSFPLEYSAGAGIVALAALVGRKVGIRPKRHDDWLVVPNLWGAAVGPPSIQKSPPVEEALRPLHRLAKDAKDAYEAAQRDFEARSLMAKAKAKAAKDALEKAAKSKDATPEKLKQLAEDAAACEEAKEPVCKRYVTNDSTVEMLGVLLAQNPDGVLLFRDELIAWLKSLDKQGRESDRGFYLEAWNGTGSFVYDRIGRGTLFIPSVCVSVFGTIQPGPLARYVRAAFADGNDGLIQRFQFLLYPEPPATWVNVDRYLDTDAKNRAYKVFQALDGLKGAAVGAEEDRERGMPFLRFAGDAQDLFDGWRSDLENRLRSGTDNPLVQSHLGKYRSLMPSLALLFHLVEVVDGVAEGPVSLRSATCAAAWCELLEAHARRVYQSALEGDPEPALRLAERLKGSLPNPFRARHVVHKGWSGLDHPDVVERALGVLEDRGWVKSQEIPPGPSGGRPTTDYYIHPAILSGPGA